MAFLTGTYYKLAGNSNYAFLLLYEFLEQWDHHCDSGRIYNQFKMLKKHYPDVNTLADSILKQKAIGLAAGLENKRLRRGVETGNSWNLSST